MTKNQQPSSESNYSEASNSTHDECETAPPKKPFVEPVISAPIDVLETTAFLAPGFEPGSPT